MDNSSQETAKAEKPKQGKVPLDQMSQEDLIIQIKRQVVFLHKSKAKCDELALKITKYREKEDIQKEIEDKNFELEETIKSNSQFTNQLLESHKTEISAKDVLIAEITEKYNFVNREKLNAEEQLLCMEMKLSTLTETSQFLQDELKNIQEEKNACSIQIDILTEARNSAIIALKSSKERLANTEERVKILDNEREEIRIENTNLVFKLEALVAEVGSLSSENEKLQADYSSAMQKLRNSVKECESWKLKVEELENEKEDYVCPMADVVELQSKIEELEMELRKALKDKDWLNFQLQSSRDRNTKLPDVPEEVEIADRLNDDAVCYNDKNSSNYYEKDVQEKLNNALDMIRNLEKDLTKALEQKNGLVEELIQVKDLQRFLEDEAKELQEECNKFKSEVKRLEADLENDGLHILQLDKELRDSEERERSLQLETELFQTQFRESRRQSNASPDSLEPHDNLDEVNSLREEVQFYREQTTGLETENSDLKSSLDETKAELDEQNVKVKELLCRNRELDTVIQNRTDEMKIEEYEKEKHSLEEQLANEKGKNEEMSLEVNDLKVKIEGYESRKCVDAITLTEEFDVENSLLRNEQSSVVEVENELEKLRERNIVLEADVKLSKQHEASVIESLKDKSNILERIHLQMDNFLSQIEELNVALSEKERDLESLSETYRALKLKDNTLNEEIEYLLKSQESHMQDIEDFCIQNSTLRTALSHANEELGRILDQCVRFEERETLLKMQLKDANFTIDNMEQYKTENSTLQALLLVKNEELIALSEKKTLDSNVESIELKDSSNERNQTELMNSTEENRDKILSENQILINEIAECRVDLNSMSFKLRDALEENCLLLNRLEFELSLREFCAELESRLEDNHPVQVQNVVDSNQQTEYNLKASYQQTEMNLESASQQTEANFVESASVQTVTNLFESTSSQTDANLSNSASQQTDLIEVIPETLTNSSQQTEIDLKNEVLIENEELNFKIKSLLEQYECLLKENSVLKEKFDVQKIDENLNQSENETKNLELAESKDRIDKLKRVVFKLKKELNESQKIKEELSTVSRQHLSNFQSLQRVYDQLQDEFENAKENSKKHEQDMTLILTEMMNIKQQNNDLNNDLTKLQTSYDSALQDKKSQESLKTELESKLIVAKSEKETEENKLKTSKLEISKFDLKLKGLQEQLKSEKEAHTSSLQKLEENLKQSKQQKVLNLEIGHYEMAISELENKLKEKETLVVKLENETEQFKEDQFNLKENLGKVESKCLMEESRNECLKHSLEKVKKELSEAKENRELEISKQHSLRAECENLNSSREDLQVQLANSSSRVRYVEDLLKSSKENHSKASQALESRISSLEHNLDSLKSELISNKHDFESYKVRVHSVLKQKQQPISASPVDPVQYERLERTVDGFKEKIETLKDTLHAKTVEMETFQIENDNLAQRHATLVDELRKKDKVWSQMQEQIVKDRESTVALFEAEKTQFQQQKVITDNQFKQQIRILKEEHAIAVELLEKQLEMTEKEAVNYQKELIQQKNVSSTITSEELPFDISSLERQDGEGSECTGTGTPSKNLSHIMIPTTSFTPLEQLLQSNIEPAPISPTDTEALAGNIILANKKIDHLAELLNESESNNMRLTEQVRLLKEEIRRLERNKDREEIVSNLEYLKNVVVKFLTLQESNERERLVPVITTMLKLSPEEQQIIQKSVSGDPGGAANGSNWGSYLPRWSGLM